MIDKFRKIFFYISKIITSFYNFIIKTFNPAPKIDQVSEELREILLREMKKTDISDHLETLFIESLEMNPKVIVELGVRNGESTFVLERVAKLCNSQLISVDITDCSNISSFKQWHFIQSDDITFAYEYSNWCKDNGIDPNIDVLFIDTSHLYEHTLREIQLWFPYLSTNAKVIFHDTNSLTHHYFRKDHSLGWGGTYNGVANALETYFNKQFNWKIYFLDYIQGWIIKHYPYCNGFTVLTRITE